VLGWNDTDELRVVDPARTPALASLRPYRFPPWGVTSRPVKDSRRHVYSFYRAEPAPTTSLAIHTLVPFAWAADLLSLL
jgi:hypothetical protein